MPEDSSFRIIRFGTFEVNLHTGELRQRGQKVRLQEQPFQVLAALVERPGELVTREELRSKLWPSDTFVDFDHGLNAAIKRLRDALGESADAPVFIETMARRGYRFIAPVDGGSTASGIEITAPERPKSSLVRSWSALALLSSVVIAVLVWAAAWRYRWQYSEVAPSSNIRSIAVLPLANLSGDPSQDYFADAMTEELTSNLGNIAALRVVSRTSAMHYKKTPKTMPEIAQELNVDGVIEGSVLRSGDRVRITAELINARSDRHLWSESYERDLKDILELQSELARTIAGQVRAVVTPAEEERLHPESVNPEAYEAYLRGRFYLEKWTPDGAGEGLRYFQRAIEIDSSYALAYVGMAECYTVGIPGVSDGLDHALNAATRALELNPHMGEAHAMVGNVRMFRDWDFSGAEGEFKKAVSLSPNYGPAHHWYSHLLMNLGRFDESLVESKRMLDLDPMSPAANLHLGDHYLAARQWDLAIAQNQKTVLMDPNYVDAHHQLGEAYLGKRMYPEAIAELSRAAELMWSRPGYTYHRAVLGSAYALAGDTVSARKVLAEIGRLDQPFEAALIYSGLGDRDRSMALLNEAYHRHDISLELNFIVELDPLRSDPRFRDLVRRVGLSN